MKYVAILHMANTWLHSYAHLIPTCTFVWSGGNVKFYGQEQGSWKVSSFCKNTRQYFVVSLPRCFKMPIPFIRQHTHTHTHGRTWKSYTNLLNKLKISVSWSHVTIIPGLSSNFTFYPLLVIYLASFWWAGHCAFSPWQAYEDICSSAIL